MKGIIVNFRSSARRQYDNQMVIQAEGVNSEEKAASLVGKTVVYTTEGGKELKGKISSVHGRNGAVRVIFETGMPGQSLGKPVRIE